VTAGEGLVYFGSSVDNKVYALNARTGEVEWTFFTAGPVRYAPTLWKERIYVGSDDGYVYCLKARDGKMVWKYRAGPSEERVLGNGRMISLWPIRTSVLVDGGVAYFGAGVFPYEGIYICALKADDGSVVWKNDTIGDRAHELAFGGISPQGYLVASQKILYVPSGRAMPAAFDRQTGDFLYYCLPGAKVGGTWALLDGENLIAGADLSGRPAKVAYDQATGKRQGEDVHAWFPGIDLVVTPEVSYTLTENGVYALERQKYQEIRTTRLNAIREEQQELRSRRSDLWGKIGEADEAEAKKLQEQREEVEAQLRALDEEEQGLKPSMFKWEYSRESLCALMLAGDLVIAGGEGIIVAVEAETGREVWKAEVAGKVYGLAVATGNLYVSAGDGSIYCFGAGEGAQGREVSSPIDPSPYREDKLTRAYEAAASTIVEEARAAGRKGYCLVLGCGTGRLAFELARRTDLHVIGIEADPKKVAAAKKSLDAAGLFGSRVVVEQWDLGTLPDYFADLVVSDEMVVTGEISDAPEEVFRVLKPLRGVAFLGQPRQGRKRGKTLELAELLEWLQASGAPTPKLVEEDGTWAKATRGGLEGAGAWTGQYGNPQNTASSGDQLVRSPLGVLWFGEPGPKRMVERHAKAASPVAIDGRLFIQGEEVVMAYDAYNGISLWEREIKGAVRARADLDGGNLAAAKEGLYVAAHEKCYRLDPATGETVRMFEMPPAADGSARRWGHVSYADNTLYGSRAMPLKNEYFALLDIFVDEGQWREIDEIPPEVQGQYQWYRSRYPVPDKKLLLEFKRSGTLWHSMADFPSWEIYLPAKGAVTERMMVSDMVFAVDPETGELRWTHEGDRIAHITIAMGDGALFFAESAISEEEKERGVAERRKLVEKGVYEEAEGGEVPDEDLDVRRVVALDAGTGEKRWGKPLDVTGCGGDAVAMAYRDGVLLLFGSVGSHDAWRFRDGELRWKRITALAAETGAVLWSRPINYRVRPVIVGERVFIEPRVCDLRTGEIETRSHPVTGASVPWEYLRPGHTCAITSASAHALFYRSYSTAFYDFSADNGLTLFGGIRPGCWINLIPANGVLLFPEASAGCTCSFPLRCSVAFKHKKDRAQPWTVFITHGALSPVRHFAINLGAPADMKDEGGRVWFGYPNPRTEYMGNHYRHYGVKFDLRERVLPGMGFFCADFKGTEVEGTDRPWLFASGCVGLERCEVPLIDEVWEEASGVFTVRLGFSAPAGDRLGQRVFAVELQGEPVLKDFDILKEAASPNKAVVKEFKGIEVKDVLAVGLVPEVASPTMAQAPLINFIEVVREDAPEVAGTRRPVEPMERSAAEALLQAAKVERDRKNQDRALEMYHAVLDGAPAADLKQEALAGMAAIGSPKSLRPIAPYCREIAPVLWDFREPEPELANSAIEVLVAIANNTAEKDRQKAVKMLKRALVADDPDLHQRVVSSLEELGVEIAAEAAHPGKWERRD